MKKIVLLLFLFVNLFAIDPAVDFSEHKQEIQDYNVFVEHSQITIEEAENQKREELEKSVKEIEENTEKSVEDLTSLFMNFEISSCSVDSFKCPPLKTEISDKYYVRTDFLDPKNSKISCSILDKEFIFKKEKQSVIEQKEFSFQACKQEFSVFAASNQATDDTEVVELKDQLKTFKFQLDEAILQSTNNDSIKSENYLDLADLFDRTISMNPSIDLKSSVVTDELVLASNFTSFNNDNQLHNDIYKNIKSFLYINYNDMSSSELSNIVLENVDASDRNNDLVTSTLNSFQHFYVRTNSIFNMFAFFILTFFALFFVFRNSLKATISKAHKNNHEMSNISHSTALFLLSTLVFFSGSSEKITINNETFDVKITRAQQLLQLGFQTTNETRDRLANAVFESKKSSLRSKINLPSVSKVDYLAAEKNVLKKEFEYLKSTDLQCSKDYDTVELARQKAKFYDEESKTVVGQRNRDAKRHHKVSPYSLVNPYLKNEDEAIAVTQEIHNLPYEIESKFVFVNNFKSDELNRHVPEIFDSENRFTSISACFFNRQKMIQNQTRLREINKIFKELKNEENNNKKMEMFIELNKILEQKEEQLGYLSVAFLPVFDLLIERSAEAFQSNNEKSIDNETDYVAEVSKSVPVLALFGGSSIKEVYDKTILAPLRAAKKTYDESLAGKAGKMLFLGGAASNTAGIALDATAYTLSYHTILQIIEAIELSVFVFASIAAFLFLYIQQIIYFISSMFAPVLSVLDNAESRLMQFAEKIVSLLLYSVLLVVAIYFASLFSSFVEIMLNFFTNDFLVLLKNFEIVDENWLDSIKNSTQYYSFLAIANVVSMILKIIIVPTIIFKFPSAIIDVIGLASSTVSDSIASKFSEITETENKRLGI